MGYGLIHNAYVPLIIQITNDTQAEISQHTQRRTGANNNLTYTAVQLRGVEKLFTLLMHSGCIDYRDL